MGRPSMRRTSVGRPSEHGGKHLGCTGLSVPTGREAVSRANMSRACVGRPSVGRASMGRPSVGQPSMGQANVGQASVGQASVGPANVGQVSVRPASVCTRDPAQWILGSCFNDNVMIRIHICNQLKFRNPITCSLLAHYLLITCSLLAHYLLITCSLLAHYLLIARPGWTLLARYLLFPPKSK